MAVACSAVGWGFSGREGTASALVATAKAPAPCVSVTWSTAGVSVARAEALTFGLRSALAGGRQRRAHRHARIEQPGLSFIAGPSDLARCEEGSHGTRAA